jgi:hypothetical protein
MVPTGFCERPSEPAKNRPFLAADFALIVGTPIQAFSQHFRAYVFWQPRSRPEKRGKNFIQPVLSDMRCIYASCDV